MASESSSTATVPATTPKRKHTQFLHDTLAGSRPIVTQGHSFSFELPHGGGGSDLDLDAGDGASSPRTKVAARFRDLALGEGGSGAGGGGVIFGGNSPLHMDSSSVSGSVLTAGRSQLSQALPTTPSPPASPHTRPARADKDDDDVDAMDEDGSPTSGRQRQFTSNMPSTPTDGADDASGPNKRARLSPPRPVTPQQGLAAPAVPLVDGEVSPRTLAIAVDPAIYRAVKAGGVAESLALKHHHHHHKSGGSSRRGGSPPMSSHQHAAIAAALSSPLRQPHASGSSTLVAGFAETQGQLLSSSPSSAASDASGPESLLASPMSPETASTGAIVDPLRASLTWRDDEITVYDPLDSDDDGEGVNGIGFRPSPALAHQRAMQRRRQLAEYRRREESEARERRRERRNAVGARGGVVPLEMAGLHDQAPGQGGDNGGSGDARAAGGAAGDAETRFLGTSTPRRVRFAEAPDVTEMEPLAAAGL